MEKLFGEVYAEYGAVYEKANSTFVADCTTADRADKQSEAVSEEIARRVNAHEALVEALREAVKTLDRLGYPGAAETYARALEKAGVR